MALFSRKVDYALVVLSYLHHRPEGGCSRAIAERFGLKAAFTAKVLKLLCKSGLIRGQRGMGGGYVLARAADAVRLDELLGLLEEPFALAECSGGSEACGLAGACPVRVAVVGLDRRIREMLRSVTLAELFREQHQERLALGLPVEAPCPPR